MPINNLTKFVDVTPTITAGAYSAGDVVGGLMTLNVASAGGGGVIKRVIIADGDNEKAAGSIYVFTASPTSFADNAAFAPVIGDFQKLIGVIPVAAGDYVTVNSEAYALIKDLSLEYVCPTGNLFAYFVTATGVTPTYGTTSDLQFRFVVWCD